MWSTDYTRELYEAIDRDGISMAPVRRAGCLARRAPDVVHIHWTPLLTRTWPMPVGGLLWLLVLVILKMRGTKIVHTAHNIRPHEGWASETERRVQTWIDGLVDGVVLHTPSAHDELVAGRPGLRNAAFRFVPLGLANPAAVGSISRAEARRRIGIRSSGPVLLAFGSIRRYKGFHAFGSVLRRLPTEDVQVLIAGQPWDTDLASQLKGQAAADPRLTVCLGRLEDDDLATLISASDAVVLPYADVHSSGVAVLALASGRPLIGAARGMIPWLRDLHGAEWVHTYEGTFDDRAFQDSLRWLEGRSDGSSPVRQPSWTEIADATVDFYREIVGRNGETSQATRGRRRISLRRHRTDR